MSPRNIVVFGPGASLARDCHLSLLRGLCTLGHRATYVERNPPGQVGGRRVAGPPFCEVLGYESLEDLRGLDALRDADLAIVGSNVPDGTEMGEWVLREARCPVAFYDTDTPATLARLWRGDCGYPTARLIGRFSMVLSATGGPAIRQYERLYGAAKVLPLYPSYDPALYYAEPRPIRWDLGCLGGGDAEAHPSFQEVMLDPARAWRSGGFVLVDGQPLAGVEGLDNVDSVVPGSAAERRAIINSLRFAMVLSPADAIRTGWTPSASLFEAAACGTPVISDYWDGLGDLFEIDSEVLVSDGTESTLGYLCGMREEERIAVGERARRRVLGEHTAVHRAEQLEGYLERELAIRAVTLM